LGQVSQMAATIRNDLKELPVSLGQLGHPDWDKRVIVRFIIAAAYCGPGGPDAKAYMAYVLALQSA
jgi:hypothetical protein